MFEKLICHILLKNKGDYPEVFFSSKKGRRFLDALLALIMKMSLVLED